MECVKVISFEVCATCLLFPEIRYPMTDNQGRDGELWHYKAAYRASLFLELRVKNLAPTMEAI